MACCYVLSRWDRRGGASVTRQAPGPDSGGMRSGSGGGGSGDCGFKSAQGALESAVQSFVAKHSGAAEPGAGGTGQPAAR